MCYENMIETLKQLNVDVLYDIIACNGDGILVCDQNQHIVIANPAVCKMTGYELHELIGQPYSLLDSDNHDELFYQDMFENLYFDGTWHGELWNRKRDGSVFPVCQTVSVIHNKDGSISHHVFIIRDNTKLKQYEQQLQDLAFRDPLTNLYNRRFFFEHVTSQLSQFARTNTSFAVFVIDLDNFSTINNTYGHEFGDKLLVSISARLSKIFSRKSDTVARLGGDEFVAVISNLGSTEEEVSAVCEKISKKIINSLAQPHRLDEIVTKESASIGVVYTIDNCIDIAELISQADTAMYEGKYSGKNTYKIYPVDDCIS